MLNGCLNTFLIVINVGLPGIRFQLEVVQVLQTSKTDKRASSSVTNVHNTRVGLRSKLNKLGKDKLG